MPLKLVLRGIIIVSHSISSYKQNKKQSLFVFLICRFPLFLKDLFFQTIYLVETILLEMDKCT